jgi:hypothetical protein
MRDGGILARDAIKFARAPKYLYTFIFNYNSMQVNNMFFLKVFPCFFFFFFLISNKRILLEREKTHMYNVYTKGPHRDYNLKVKNS